MSFDKCVQSPNHPHNQVLEHFSHPVLGCPCLQVRSFPECHVNGVVQHVALFHLASHVWDSFLLLYLEVLVPPSSCVVLQRMDIPQCVHLFFFSWSFGWFPVVGDYENSRCKHSGTGLCADTCFHFLSNGIVGSDGQKPPNCFLSRLCQFASPPVTWESSSGSTSSPTLGIISLSYFSPSSECMVISRHGFNLHFPSDSRCRVSLQICIPVWIALTFRKVFLPMS